MVVSHAVNFWDRSKANEILLLLFWEYDLGSSGHGQSQGEHTEDWIYPEI